MSRSTRKSRKTSESGKRKGSAANPQASAAFATAHQFAETPAAGKAAQGKRTAKSKPKTGQKKAAAAAAPAERPEGAEPTKRPEAEATERPEAAEATVRPEAAEAAEPPQSPETAEPAAAAPDETERAPAGAAREAEPATARQTGDEYLAEAAEADERPGPGTDPYAGAAATQAPPRPEPPGAEHPAGAAHLDDLPPEHESERPGFAAIALAALVGIIAVVVLTLWLAPMVAPHLPGPVARYLAPGQLAVEDRIAELEARIAEEQAAIEEETAALGEERAALAAEVERLQARVDELAEARPGQEARTELEAAAGERAGLAERLGEIEATVEERAPVVRQVTELETAIGNMRAEIAAMNQALAEAEEGEGPTNPELAAALAQLQSRVESMATDMQTARAGIDEQIAGLADRLDERLAELSARVDRALERTEAAETARAEAEAEAARTAATAALREALAALETRFARGEPYADALARVEEQTETEAPPALAAPAETGLPTAARLAEELSRVAPEALAAARADAPEDGPLESLVNWARAQVAGRPTVETAGTGVGATLSRVEARLEEGDVAAALAEAETLPAAALAAIEPWLERLSARVAAERALAEWRAGLSAAG